MSIDERGLEATITCVDSPREDTGMVGRELWEEMHRLRKDEGLSVSALARRFDLDRKTVRRCLAESAWQPYQRTVPRHKQLDKHAELLRQRAPEVDYSARIL